MKLTHQQVSNLIELVVTTKSDSLGCDGCLELMDQFAQTQLDGTEVPDAIEAVRVHLEQCKCCKDEYQSLLIALRSVLPLASSFSIMAKTYVFAVPSVTKSRTPICLLLHPSAIKRSTSSSRLVMGGLLNM